MSQDYLGLFDTPPSHKQKRFSIAVIGLLLAIFIAASAVRDIQLGEIDAFVPMIDTATTLIDLITATLIYVQAAVFRSRALNVLASGYLFTAAILIPHALTFPGAFAPEGLLGAGVSTTAWLYIFWRASVPIAVILYVVLKWRESAEPAGTERAAVGVIWGILAAVALAGALTLLATAGQDLLPPLYVNRSEANYPNIMGVVFVLVALFLVAAPMLLWRRTSVLDLWLLVVLAAWLVQTLFLTTLRGRFTVTWYTAIIVVLLSHVFLMIALIAESSRLYARLALATAMQNREREARLMSLDGVTAAIAHEVAQPLSAVILNATAGVNWLTRDRPETEKALSAMRDTIKDGQRTFDVIKSIRATFAKGPRVATEFNLNDLVRETAALRRTELESANITLELDLDPGVAPVSADRVQLQRVLVNLFTNAIESLGASPRRRRQIVIRSRPHGRRDVLLEISDTGIGIAPDQIEHIFDAFFTTKATGTGLGLSLCRTIVEEHGGRLWASRGEKHGAVFHIQLPQS